MSNAGGGRAPVGSRGGDRGRSEGNAGAWAAAAVVLAIGALGFGVVSLVRIDDIQSRVTALEARPRSTAPIASAPTSVTTDPVPVGLEPDSPEEARADVVSAFVTVYDGSKPGEERLAFIDDPTGVSEAFAAAGTGQFAKQAEGARARIQTVTFTSPKDATVTYSVVSDGVAQLGNRVGNARLVGNTWKVTRSTVCADLTSAGAPCDG